MLWTGLNYGYEFDEITKGTKKMVKNIETMSKGEYFAKFNIHISEKVSLLINKADDIMAVFDAVYLRNVKYGTDFDVELTEEQYRYALKHNEKYFNDKGDFSEEELEDLSSSLSGLYWYITYEDKNLITAYARILDIEQPDANKYLFELPE